MYNAKDRSAELKHQLLEIKKQYKYAKKKFEDEHAKVQELELKTKDNSDPAAIRKTKNNVLYYSKNLEKFKELYNKGRTQYDNLMDQKQKKEKSRNAMSSLFIAMASVKLSEDDDSQDLITKIKKNNKKKKSRKM